MEERQKEMPKEKRRKVRELAEQVLALSRDNILVSLRFLDVAMMELSWQAGEATGCIATDGSTVWYDPAYVLRLYQRDPRLVTRSMLHLLLHCIFSTALPMTRWSGSCGTWRRIWQWRA